MLRYLFHSENYCGERLASLFTHEFNATSCLSWCGMVRWAQFWQYFGNLGWITIPFQGSENNLSCLDCFSLVLHFCWLGGRISENSHVSSFELRLGLSLSIIFFNCVILLFGVTIWLCGDVDFSMLTTMVEAMKHTKLLM